MKSTRTRAKNDVIGSRRSEPIILSNFLSQFYQGRVCKYAHGWLWLSGESILPSRRSYFTSTTTIRRIGNEQHWVSKLFPGLHQFSSDFCIDEWFWSDVRQTEWNGMIVNVTLSRPSTSQINWIF
ncbi:hypothetical protein AVEN_135909-1 [Araneus ventricosus]|uniref:Uncharacterized protein n=1 Tax=Araneus ventricosus TaxID=182803 RepID=A0A4Y2NDR1_ARAVE|nr:hypothetical protein AVEN_135909-1 [Araneus ventricosus]